MYHVLTVANGVKLGKHIPHKIVIKVNCEVEETFLPFFQKVRSVRYRITRKTFRVKSLAGLDLQLHTM